MAEKNAGNFLGLFLLGTTLALGIFFSTVIISGTLENIKLSDLKISVKGYAEKDITSDLATWSGAFSVTSPDLISAYKKLENDLEKALNFLGSKGISKNDVEVSSVSTSYIYERNEKGYSTNKLESYNLSQTISIESTDINLIENISNQSTSLIKEGLAFDSYTPSYFYTKINDLKIEMLGEATKDARERAEKLAENSGGKVGSLISASQGVFQITPKNSTDVSDYGMLDNSSIDKTIKAVVTVDYSIR